MIIDLVDDIGYTRSNCFAHQLYDRMQKLPDVSTLGLESALRSDRPTAVICRLKQRTLHSNMERISGWLGEQPIVVFDQDPWHAYMDDSPYKGVYHRAAGSMNLRGVAVTSRAWADRITKDGLPGMFTSMWILPDYCESGLDYATRSVNVGFVGTLHPHRRRLFDALDDMHVQVNVQGGNNLPYDGYLRALDNIRIFIHSEDSPITVNGSLDNLKDALWIKDVEAAARGCFTIRNSGAGAGSYYDGVETTRLYDSVDEIPAIIDAIERMEPVERQASIHRSVEFIRVSDRWRQTANRLLETVTT